MIHYYGYHTLRTLAKKQESQFHNVKFDRDKINEAGIVALKKKKFIVLFREPAMSQFSWYSHRVRECVNIMHAEIVDGKSSNIITKHKLISLSHHCQYVGVTDLNTSILIQEGKQSYYKHLWHYHEYLKSNKFILDEGYYQDHLQQWIDVVGRDKIFVLNFNYLIKNPGDSLYRISQFLNIKNIWGKYNETLPHTNDSPKQHLMNCKDYKHLYDIYSKKNEGLYDLINSNDRPTMEPPFEKFEMKDGIC
jgi:hypothetical protein